MKDKTKSYAYPGFPAAKTAGCPPGPLLLCRRFLSSLLCSAFLGRFLFRRRWLVV